MYPEPVTPDLPSTALAAVDFVGCATPAAWLDAAVANVGLLLTDHANCEKKAAATALSLMFRYVDKPELLGMLSRLAREELLHFEQVVGIMQQRAIVYRQLTAGRYAGELRRHVRAHEPGKLVDVLIIGAFIEARSCERFAALAPRLDAELGRYYRFLLRSEERHYIDYLEMAQRYDVASGATPVAFAARVAYFREIERALIETPDNELRFHSGIPPRDC